MFKTCGHNSEKKKVLEHSRQQMMAFLSCQTSSENNIYGIWEGKGSFFHSLKSICDSIFRGEDKHFSHLCESAQ